MKIALVTPYDYPFPGGVTEHIRALDREFRARGHETRILAASSAAPETLAPNVIPVTDAVLRVPFNGSTARISVSPQILDRVAAILEAERFDVIHLHEPGAPLLNWAVLGEAQTVTVGTFHALIQDQEATSSSARFFREWAYKALDGHILVSPALRPAFDHSTQEYRIIPNGIDVARFAAAAIEPLPEFDDGRPNLLFVGRMEPRKGLPVLLEAFPQIKQAVPAARLLVVGAFSAEDRLRLRSDLEARGVDDVHLIGRVSAEALPRYYRSATLYCAPSLGGESFGIVLLEGMAAGLPVVASRIAGYQSVMTDGCEGRLVAPGNAAALAQAVTGLLLDGKRRKQMAACGQENAQRYDWGKVAPQVLGYYEELLQARDLRPTRKQNPLRLTREFNTPFFASAEKEVAHIRMDIKGLMHWDVTIR